MVKWEELRTFTYDPPGDLPPAPMAPRAAFEAVADDGARLEAFRWGSTLGDPFVLELRRHGAPRCTRLRDAHGPSLEGEDAETPCPCCGRSWELHGVELTPAGHPRLEELQAAADQLVPAGCLLMLALVSNGADAQYPEGPYHSLRLVQAAVDLAAAPGAREAGRSARAPRGGRA